MRIVLQVIALVLSVLGVILTSKKRRSCWIASFSAGVAWIALYVQAKLYISILAQILFMSLYVYGWIQWREKKSEHQAPRT